VVLTVSINLLILQKKTQNPLFNVSRIKLALEPRFLGYGIFVGEGGGGERTNLRGDGATAHTLLCTDLFVK